MTHKNCHDYVIKEGKLIGDFETMYQVCNDPWCQSQTEMFASEKAIALNALKKINAKKVLELGCGLGYFTQQIKDIGIDVLGVDVSQTAIKKASQTFPECTFRTADILDLNVYREYAPDVIVMAEITWYILDKLEALLSFLKTEMNTTHIIHILTTYPEKTQTYGKNMFTNLTQIKSYFGANYLEWGEFASNDMNPGEKGTYFLANWQTANHPSHSD